MMNRQYYVYMLTNKNNTVLHTGVTNNLIRRVSEHKQKLMDSFTKKYNVRKLVYYETFDDPENAIQREKAIKNLLRKKKDAFVQEANPLWKDLYPEIL